MSELQGIARFRFHPGRVEDFKRMANECMEIVRAKDPGTLQYEVYFNADETECIVLERYRDSDALLADGANIGDEMMAAIIATGDVHGELLGEPSPKLRANFADDGPVQLFSRYISL